MVYVCPSSNSKKKKQKNTLTKLKLALTLLDSVVWHIVAGGNSSVEEMHGSNHFYIAAIYFSVAWTAKYK